MFGYGKFQLGDLVEPTRSVSDKQLVEFKHTLWPTIVEAGDKMEAHAQISSPGVIVILKHDQQFPRSGKGSILRNTTYEEYHKEIETIYAQLEPNIEHPTTTAIMLAVQNQPNRMWILR